MKKEDYGDAFERFDPFFIEASQKYGVPVEVGKTIAIVESDLGLHPRVAIGLLDPNNVEGSISEDGLSWGVMQLRLETARDFDLITTPQKLNDPEYSIDIAFKLLARLSKRFQGTEEWIVKAYNQGSTATMREKNGVSPGRADEYWVKYQNRKELLS